MELVYVTKKNRHKQVVYRDQFITALTTKVDNLTPSHANVLFSAFDTTGKNQINYSAFVANCLLISKPESSALEILKEMWLLYKFHKGDYLAMENISEIFTLPCASHSDMTLMEAELKENFRPACYKLAASVEKVADTSSLGDANHKEAIKLRPLTTTFNLCNGVITMELFMTACRTAESTVQLFEDMRRDLLKNSNVKQAAKIAQTKSVADRVKEIKTRRVSLIM
jgi:hypothetical protein